MSCVSFVSSSFSFPLLFDLLAEGIFSAILFPFKSLVATAVFHTTLLEAVFAASTSVFVAVSLLYLANDKKTTFFKIFSFSWLN